MTYESDLWPGRTTAYKGDREEITCTLGQVAGPILEAKFGEEYRRYRAIPEAVVGEL